MPEPTRPLPQRPPDRGYAELVEGPDPDGPALDDEVSEDLLLRFQLGERGAFDAIVGRYQAPLTRFFYRLCWDLDSAEDFVQDVFLKLVRGARRYRSQGKLSTFLFRIATNRWIDHYRAMKPRPNLYSIDRSDLEDETPLADRLPADVADSGEGVDAEQGVQRLQAALDCLSLPHRLVFELAVYQNLPYQEISQLLDIPEGTVKSRMHNAAKVLKQLLRHGNGGDHGLPRRAPPRGGGTDQLASA